VLPRCDSSHEEGSAIKASRVVTKEINVTLTTLRLVHVSLLFKVDKNDIAHMLLLPVLQRQPPSH
jgi:hypothetical protein